MDISIDLSPGASLGRFIASEAIFLPHAVRQVIGGDGPVAGRRLGFLTGSVKSIESRVAIFRSEIDAMTRVERREHIVPHLKGLQNLSSDLATARSHLDLFACGSSAGVASFQMGEPSNTIGLLDAASQQITDLLFPRFEIWVRGNPERAALEDICQAVRANEPDSQVYLASYAHEIGLPSKLRYRDALAKAIDVGNWKRRDIADVRNYLRTTSIAFAKGEDGLNFLVKQSNFCSLSRALEDGSVSEVETEPSEDEIVIELPTTNIPGFSDDMMLVLRARQEGLTYTAMPAVLSKTTAEYWSDNRVQAAKKEINRKKHLIRPLVQRNRLFSNSGLVHERLSSGTRVYTLKPATRYMATVIRNGIPVCAA